MLTKSVPRFKVKKKFTKVPIRKWRRGRDSKAQEERGGNESRLRAGKEGAGGGQTAGCPVAVFRQSFVPVFRGSGSTVQPPSGKSALPGNAVLLAMLQLFYSFIYLIL